MMAKPRYLCFAACPEAYIYETKNNVENRTLPDGDIEKEFAGLRCCCLELDRKSCEIESCKFHQSLNVNILGLGDPNVMKTISRDCLLVFFKYECCARQLR